MSASNLKRIKEIRQKTGDSNNLFKSIPLGTNGLLVDMLSNLDLEEELKLGNDHYVFIDQNELSLTITEYYTTSPRRNTPIEDMIEQGKVRFIVITEFLEEQYEEKYLVNNKFNELIFAIGKEGQDSNSYIVIQRNKQKSTNSTFWIKTSLYENNINHLLHQKNIAIHSYQDENGKIDYIIDQQVDVNKQEMNNPFEG